MKSKNKFGISLVQMITMLLMVFGVLSTNTVAKENCNCNVNLYISDDDTNGTNVRNSPKGIVSFVISYFKSGMNTVQLCNEESGWFQITEHGSTEQRGTNKLKDAWIHGSVISTDLRYKNFPLDTIYQYTKPSSHSQTKKPLTKIAKIKSCKGEWLEVITQDGNAAWLAPEDQCGNYLTTCP